MTNSVSAADIIDEMEKWAPKSLAYDWDNVGLQVGTLNKSVSKVLVTLDVIEAVVDEAVEKGVDLIIAHHPLFFKSLSQLDIDSRRGRILHKLLKHNITVYAAHTNLDIADGGVSDMLADLIGMKEREVLAENYKESLLKLVVFVPDSHAEQVRSALGEAGAGHLGDYSHCSFQTKGQGAFKPEKGSNPYLGSQEKLERVNEVKVETIIRKRDIEKLLKTLFDVHPYEEPAYDLLPLANQGDAMGAGRIGYIPEVLTIKELCKQIKEKWKVPDLRVVGDLDTQVKKVAVLGGSGESFIPMAKVKQADVYITGDLTFHDSQDAWQEGMCLIDTGHYAEKVMKKAVKKYLVEQFRKEAGIEILESEVNSDPFHFV